MSTVGPQWRNSNNVWLYALIALVAVACLAAMLGSNQVGIVGEAEAGTSGYTSEPPVYNLPAGEKFVQFAPDPHNRPGRDRFITASRAPEEEPRRLSVISSGHTPGSTMVLFYIQEH